MTPRHTPRNPTSPQDWLTHAASDLALAKLGLNSEVLPEQICFHAQQAAEKALKALLLGSGIEFPFTHDIEELLDRLHESGIDVPDVLQESSMLTPYAVETRYPGFWGALDEDDVREALEISEQLLAWVQQRITNI